MDQIKLAFQKAKEDINLLQQEVFSLKEQVSSFNLFFKDIISQLTLLNKKIDFLSNSISSLIPPLKYPLSNSLSSTSSSYLNNSTAPNFKEDIPTHPLNNSTDLQQTHLYKTTPSLKNNLFKPQKAYFYNISTGNKGVPTDRQTDQQTDRQTGRELLRNTNSSPLQDNPNLPNFVLQNYKRIQDFQKSDFNSSSLQNLLNNTERLNLSSKKELLSNKDNLDKNKDQFKEALNVLTSLDSLKKEIKQKFKRLTDQEFLVFSTIYQLEEENKPINYKILSSILNLTESSIRDYVGRLLTKNVPLIKEKINNKTIKLSISSEFKKIIPLNSLINLRSI